MEISEMRKKIHLSSSSVNDYIDCGLLYKFGRIDKIPSEFRSDAMEFGSAIHRVLAEFYQAKMIGEKLSVKDLHSLFEMYWGQAAEGITNIKYAEGKDFNILLLEGKELLTTYYGKLPEDNFRVISIEEPFSFYIDELEVPIIGVTDLIEEDESGTIIVTDWKTSGRAYSSDEVDKNFQLTLYYTGLKANGYVNREMLLKFDCLIKTKTPKFEQYYTSRTVEDSHRAIKKIMQVWNGIKQGVFIPNDGHWKCGGCHFKQHCDEWFKGGS